MYVESISTDTFHFYEPQSYLELIEKGWIILR